MVTSSAPSLPCWASSSTPSLRSLVPAAAPSTPLAHGAGGLCNAQSLCCQNNNFVTFYYFSASERSFFMVRNRHRLSLLAAVPSPLPSSSSLLLGHARGRDLGQCSLYSLNTPTTSDNAALVSLPSPSCPKSYWKDFVPLSLEV